MTTQKYNLKRLMRLQDTESDNLIWNVKRSNGVSFLVGWSRLKSNSHLFTFDEIKQYIMLAGLRDYNEYVRTGILSLDLDFCPVPESILRKNRMLFIMKNNLFFQYEEEAISV